MPADALMKRKELSDSDTLPTSEEVGVATLLPPREKSMDDLPCGEPQFVSTDGDDSWDDSDLLAFDMSQVADKCAAPDSVFFGLAPEENNLLLGPPPGLPLPESVLPAAPAGPLALTLLAADDSDASDARGNGGPASAARRNVAGRRVAMDSPPADRHRPASHGFDQVADETAALPPMSRSLSTLISSLSSFAQPAAEAPAPRRPQGLLSIQTMLLVDTIAASGTFVDEPEPRGRQPVAMAALAAPANVAGRGDSDRADASVAVPTSWPVLPVSSVPEAPASAARQTRRTMNVNASGSCSGTE